MTGSSPAKSPEFYLLKDGEMLGPFLEDELRAGLADGRFAANDFVQADNFPVWQPLGRVLALGSGEAGGAIAPDWGCLLKWAWYRLRYSLSEQSVPAGMACLGIGTAVLLLSRWPFLFWVPWFIATAVAAIALIRRKHEVQGTILLAWVICIPLLFLIFGSMSAPEKKEAIAEKSSVTNRATEESSSRSELASTNTPPASPASASDNSKPMDLSSIPGLATPPASDSPGSALPGSTPAATPDENALPTGAKVSPGGASSPNAPSSGVAPTSPSRDAAAPAVPSADLPSTGGQSEMHGDSLVIVKGPEGSGSGFIGRAGTQTWFFTNIHVISEIKQPTLTRLDSGAVEAGNGEVAAGPDVARFPLVNSPPHPFEVITDFEKNVLIGDDVVVLGNSGGGGVVTRLEGTVLGIGPDRLEVSSKFIPGNSGSPIIHVKTGKVIGIATYLKQRADTFATETAGSGPPVIHRFGYRIDSIPAWEPVHWPALYGDADQIKNIGLLTDDIVKFFLAIRSRSEPQFATDTLRRPATDWLARIRAKRASSNDRLSATQSLFGSLRLMVRSDVAAAESRVRYTFFRNKLTDEKRDRDELYRVFDSECAELSSTLGRGEYR